MDGQTGGFLGAVPKASRCDTAGDWKLDGAMALYFFCTHFHGSLYPLMLALHASVY